MAISIEAIAIELSKVLKTLEEKLKSQDNIKSLVKALGIGLPTNWTPTNTIQSANTILTSIGKLEGLIKDLKNAIDANNSGQILSKGGALLNQLVKIVEGIKGFATALEAELKAAFPLNTPLPTPTQIAERLIAYIIAENIGKVKFVALPAALEFIGFYERVGTSGTPPGPINRLNFENLSSFLRNPKGFLQTNYKWGSTGFDQATLLTLLSRFDGKLKLPLVFVPNLTTPPLLSISLVDNNQKLQVGYTQPGTPPSVNALLAIGATSGSSSGLEIALKPNLNFPNVQKSADNWQLETAITPATSPDFKVIIHPDGKISYYTSATGLKGKGRLRWTGKKPDGKPYFEFTFPGGSSISAKEIALEVSSDFILDGSNRDVALQMGGEIRGGKLLITMDKADGFLKELLAGFQLSSDFNVGFGFNSKNGLFFHGSSNLVIQLPAHTQLGPVGIAGLTLGIGIPNKSIPISFGTTIKASLGPLSAVVEDIGVKADFIFTGDDLFNPGTNGNMGPLDLKIGFKPPRGVQLSIDASAVKGSGFLTFDYEKGEYTGALELSIAGKVNAKAIGIINTKMPDGSAGFSLLIIISAEFSPPFQLGYGFKLDAVGGLLGLNRTMVLQEIRDGIRTGSINSVMFPQNVIANAPKIINDLKKFFPPSQGKFLIGPMGKISWGTPTLITLSLGIIIEIPGNIAILGILRVTLPSEQTPLAKIQVNFVGTIDFEKQMLTFDASLFDSYILFMTLEGDMAVRVKWGDNPNFLISVGGFHPSYIPPPLALPTLRRLAINILNTSYARIRVETYFAVTSNTVQFGAAAELFFGFDEFNINGHIGFDALFQFSPFYFVISFSARFSICVFGFDALSIRINAMLEGPTPWHIKGTGSISILFWDISADIDETWGETKDTKLPSIKVWDKLKVELDHRDRWEALPPPSMAQFVSLRKLSEQEKQVLHPAGQLQVTQKILPLEVSVDKIGAERPEDWNRFEITEAVSGSQGLTLTDVNDSFAPAQYFNLSDAEKLSRQSFEPMKSGVRISLGSKALAVGKLVKRTLKYELTVVDREPKQLINMKILKSPIRALLPTFFSGNAAARSPVSMATKRKLQPFEDIIKVGDEGFAVVFASNNKAMKPDAIFNSETKALEYLNREIGKDPSMKNKIQVVPQFEVYVA